MNWFFIALIAPFLWSIVNHIDKYLLSRYFRSGGVGGLLIFSSIFGIFVLPVAYYFNPGVLDMSLVNIVIMLGLGIMTAITLLLYLYAMDMDEASIVVPFYQIIPVFGLVLGYYMLNEIVTVTQLIACAILLIGAIILTLEIDGDYGFKFKTKLFVIVIAATILIAFNEAIFKYVAIEESFWISTFWQYAGLTIFGLFLFFVPSYRTQFLIAVKDNRRWVFGLNAGSEFLTLIANLIFSFATLLAPLGIVLVTDSYRPFFVLIIGIILTVFFPHISQEKISRKHLAQKTSSILLMVLGTYLLYI